MRRPRSGDLIRITMDAGLGQNSELVGLLISSTQDEQYGDMIIHILLLSGGVMHDTFLTPEDRIEVLDEET